MARKLEIQHGSRFERWIDFIFGRIETSEFGSETLLLRYAISIGKDPKSTGSGFDLGPKSPISEISISEIMLKGFGLSGRLRVEI